MKYLIGIDIGTTGTKALLFSEKGEIIENAYEGYEVISEKAGYAEQNPKDWYEAAAKTVRKCVRKLGDDTKIAAISISAQGGTLVAVDADGNPVRKAISWLDRRATAEAKELCMGKEENYYYLHTGWRLNDGYHLAEMKWMKKHEPALFQRTVKFLSPLDYMNLCLTGKAVTDYTNEGITNLENINTWSWEESIFKDLDITEENLPEMKKAGMIVGTLTDQAAEDFGLETQTLVINGGYDQYCAALGLNAVHYGDLMLSTGTSWVLMAITSQLKFDTDTFISPCMHIVPGCFGAMASLETGGVSMEWFKNKLVSGDGYKETYETINCQVKERGLGADGVLFYPHFAGSTCPTWSKNSKGAFLGLTLFHDKYHIARAIMEGIIYEMCGILEAYKKSGIEVKRIKMAGGASKSDFWTQLIADITQLPVDVYENADAAAIGAGIIAAVGSGLFEDFESASEVFKKNVKEILPDTSLQEDYKKIRENYRRGFDYLRQFYDEVRRDEDESAVSET